MPVTVGILGPAVVVVDGVPADPGGRIVGRVLAALAIRAGDRVSTERLIDDVWGETAPAQVRASLQMHIAKLRKLLAQTPVAIETVPNGYLLDAPPGSVDVEEFLKLANDARTARSEGRWPTAADRSERALSLWRGDSVEVLDDVASLAGDLTGLQESRRQTRLIHLEARLALGEHERSVGELEEATAAEPFVERFWELLMLALYRCGRQADALAAYRRAASVLVEELGIEPGPALTRLEEQILLQEDELLELPDTGEGWVPSLPPPTTWLIDRSDEIDSAMKMTAEDRLVTILGPGGVGKTTLALEVGRRLATGCSDGAVLIDLTACARDDEVATVAAEQLGLAVDGGPLEAVTEHLRTRSMVVVVDNCEHVLGGASEMVWALVTECSDLLVLATSRRRLEVGRAGELTLAPLSVPPAGAGVSDLDEYSAVRLFVDRAHAVHPDLSLSPVDLELVGRICRRIDGLPLAIELVAAWANVLTIGDIDARLSSVLESRQRPDHRHGSLNVAIDWSYQLLSPTEQTAFDRLSVFRSFFNLDGAAAVLETDGTSALRTLGRLTDASLMNADVSGRSARYRMLETIREFGRQHLAARTDAEAVVAAHRRFVVDTALNAAGESDEAAWFDRVHDMLPDLRTVLEWAEVTDAALVVEVAERLRPFWTQRGLGSEIEPRLEAAVQQVDSASAWYTLGVMRYARGELQAAQQAFEAGLRGRCDEHDRARITNALGVLALEAGDYETAATAYRRAEELFTEAGLERGVAASLLNQGIAALNRDELEEATGLFESARTRFRDQGDRREEAHALLRLAFAADLSGSPEVALERAHAALRIVRDLGPGLALADALQYTADFEVGAGSPAAARPLLVEAVEMFVTLDHLAGLQRAMITATAVTVADEQWTEAAEVSAYAAALRGELGIPVPAANRAAVDRLDRAIAAAVPAARLDALAERARLAAVGDMAARCIDVIGGPAGSA